MENYEFRIQLGHVKARNEQEVQGLLRATESNNVILHSLLISLASLNGLGYQERLLESPQMSRLENLTLKIDISLGAESLGILAKLIEAGHISSLRHLNILYQADDVPSTVPHRSSTPQSRSSSSYSIFSSRSEPPSSYTSRSRTSSSQNSNSTKTLSPASWEGFSLLARALKNDLLPRLEKTVNLNSNWASRNLGDLGAKYLAELIETGYLASLKELDLENNSIGNDGMEALAAGLKRGNMSVLEKLNLNRNSFQSSVDGVMQVVRVVEGDYLPSLKWIGLSGAGCLPIVNQGSIADAIVAVFTRNTALTAHVEIDWPDKRRQGRWALVLERNLKLTKILERLGPQEEVPLTHGKIFICGFPGVGKTTLRKSLKRSRWGAFIGNETRPSRERPTRGIEVSKIKGKPVNGGKFTLTLWDLAGQEDFQVLHSSFLPDLGMAKGKATTFVVVFKARYNRLPSESASAEEELIYWLRFIASNSIIGVKRKVVVILNTFDGAACVERAQWVELLESLHDKYEDVLDIHPTPFVLDARVAKSVNQLKQELFEHTRNVLKGLRWPKVCKYIQKSLEGWSLENQNFPIVPWFDFVGKMAASKLPPDKLEAAVEYLHETGDLIYFRRGSLIEVESPDIKLVVLNPQWFCKRVVGQLLLPEGMLDQGETPLKRSVAPNGSLGIREIKAYFKELLASGPQVDYVLGMLFRLGLCYKLGEDKVMIPALIEEDELPARTWGRDKEHYCGHWVMGRSLALTDTERTALPKAVFRRLQVQLAQDPELGGLINSDYVVGKSYLTFKKGGMSILVQFDTNEDDPRDDRIDLICKPLVNRKRDPVVQRKEQTDLVGKIMVSLENLCLQWCPGIHFVEKVILPWSASKGALPMLERNANISVDDIKLWLKYNGMRSDSEHSDLNWSVEEEPVKEDELLSSTELHELQVWVEEKGDALQQLVVDLDIIPAEPVSDSTKTIPETKTARLGSSTALEKSEKTRTAGIPIKSTFSPLHHKIEREARGIRKHIDQRNQEIRKHLDTRLDEIVESTQEVRDNFKRAFDAQKLVLRKVQDLERLSVQELESSVPRFMYLADTERSSVWLTLRQALVKRTATLHLMCEAKYNDGLLHEVEGQIGLEINKLKDWASALVPWMERSLKVAIVVAKVVGGVLLPGLNMLLPDFQNTEGKVLSLMIATDILKYNAPSLEDKHITERETIFAERADSTSASSATEVNARAKFVLRRLLSDSDTPLGGSSGPAILEHFGLTRVILMDPHDFTRSSVVWICGPCCTKYGKLAKDIS